MYMITVSTAGFPRKSDVDDKVVRLIDNVRVIYCFYFPESDKMYIGQTESFWHRMSGYRTNIKCRRLETHQPKLYNALMKYEFKFTTTIMALNVVDLDDAEISYINMFDTFVNGYNSTGGGKVLRGEKSPMYGRKHTEETKAQMKASRMGDPRPKSIEWCQEHSERMKGDGNPKRIASIEKYRENGIDITTDTILQVYQENNNDVSETVRKIGCSWQIVKSVIDRI